MITLDAPPGWDVQIRRRAPSTSERTHDVLHAATFTLPGQRSDYGDGAVQLMGPRDVFVAVVDFGADASTKALFDAKRPRRFKPHELSRTALQHAIGRQSGLQRFFNDHGRAWCFYVVIGNHDHRAALIQRANALLRSVTLS